MEKHRLQILGDLMALEESSPEEYELIKDDSKAIFYTLADFEGEIYSPILGKVLKEKGADVEFEDVRRLMDGLEEVGIRREQSHLYANISRQEAETYIELLEDSTQYEPDDYSGLIEDISEEQGYEEDDQDELVEAYNQGDRAFLTD